MHVVTEEGDRKLVSLSIDRVSGGGYRKIADVTLKPELASVMLRDALDELMRVRARYERIKALAPVWREIDQAAQRHKEAADAA